MPRQWDMGGYGTHEARAVGNAAKQIVALTFIQSHQ